MTPLAQQIIKQLALPLKKRTFRDGAGLLKSMDDIHCFECTDVLELAKEMGAHALAGNLDERMTFLPAEKTWIEFVEDGTRVGILLQERISGKSASIIAANSNSSGKVDGFLYLGDSSRPIRSVGGDMMLEAVIIGLLAIINTPKVFGRRQHMPHRGLERALVNSRGLQGKFPLHAWTEILLRVTPPKDASSDPVAEAHYTGQKALHYCRAHLRVCLGKIVLVRGHWRGDGSLGIKRSRYVVTA